jgi:putative hemolysin
MAIIDPGDPIPLKLLPIGPTSPDATLSRSCGQARGRARSRRLAATAVLALAVLGACGDDTQPAETTVSPGIANPASEFCIEQGGTVEIVDEEDGQVGYCNLPDGSRVEEWEYMRSQTEGSGG